ncbi:MAG: phosphoglycerate kinase [Puniceicoccales bacterium]|nr:phosphoglycerate kinase [Puniceicoccales bacterium]
MSGVKLIKDVAVEGKQVFVRVDFNVPLDAQGNVSDETRIVAALPTIQFLLERGAKVILASHLGRPKGQVVTKYSLRPVARTLATKLNQPVLFLEDCIGNVVKEAVQEMAENSIVLLENLRFHAEEEANDLEFSKSLAQLADVYVNDAFGTAHRAHASTVGMVEFVPQKAVGFLIEKELQYLEQKVGHPDRPFCVILGGAKVSDKIHVIESLLNKADRILIGGAMAYTFALAQGQTVGNSLVERDKVELALQLLQKAKSKGIALCLPVDTIATDKMDRERRALGTLKTFHGSIDEGWEGVDIGPETIDMYTEFIHEAKTILWNGPVGVFEIKAAAIGSIKIAQAMATSTGTTIVGGGDCVKAVNQSGCAQQISFLSTGGGASLKLLEGKALPGLEALKQ